jgi:hypothetical protein
MEATGNAVDLNKSGITPRRTDSIRLQDRKRPSHLRSLRTHSCRNQAITLRTPPRRECLAWPINACLEVFGDDAPALDGSDEGMAHGNAVRKAGRQCLRVLQTQWTKTADWVDDRRGKNRLQTSVIEKHWQRVAFGSMQSSEPDGSLTLQEVVTGEHLVSQL